jgi:hypothetical protein
MYSYTYAILGHAPIGSQQDNFYGCHILHQRSESTNCSHWCMIWPSSHRVANCLGHHKSTNMRKIGGVVRCLVDKSPITNATLEPILFHCGWCPTRILNIVVGYTLSFFILGNSINQLKYETMLKHADIHKKRTKE